MFIIPWFIILWGIFFFVIIFSFQIVSYDDNIWMLIFCRGSYMLFIPKVFLNLTLSCLQIDCSFVWHLSFLVLQFCVTFIVTIDYSLSPGWCWQCPWSPLAEEESRGPPAIIEIQGEAEGAWISFLELMWNFFSLVLYDLWTDPWISRLFWELGLA